MITITEDGKEIARVTLVNGKMSAELIDPSAADLIEHMRSFSGMKLSDTEAYKAMPFRMTGRTNARVSGEKIDASTFEAIEQKFARHYAEKKKARQRR